ncbi:MAG: hypothetical protein KF708_06980 [Pirellulales bacterium]|nr:hypothetical protein [Pirellulales bacterium]
MPSIVQSRLEELLPQLPKLEEITAATLTEYSTDLYLCALGFEERCHSIPALMGQNQCAARQGVYITVRTNREDNERNLPRLHELMQAFCGTTVSLDADDPNFERTLKRTISHLATDVGQTPTITFDISVAANRLLLRTFKTLLESDVNLRIVYAEAAAYHPTHDEYHRDKERWTADGTIGMEEGVSFVVPSPSYAGQQLDPLPNCVILFPSFRKDRSLAVLSAVDETLVVSRHEDVMWIIGRPHHGADAWRIDAMREINQIPPDSPQQEIGTFDYLETLMELERIYRRRWERYNITISPLGSKLQAIGIGLFCYLHPEIRVMFSAPRRYNAQVWSSGCRAAWSITFDSTIELRERLAAVGQISIVP